jgi:hypothetical protein
VRVGNTLVRNIADKLLGNHQPLEACDGRPLEACNGRCKLRQAFRQHSREQLVGQVKTCWQFSVAAFAAVRMPRQRSVTVFATVKSSSQLSKHVLTACCQKKSLFLYRPGIKTGLQFFIHSLRLPKALTPPTLMFYPLSGYESYCCNSIFERPHDFDPKLTKYILV